VDERCKPPVKIFTWTNVYNTGDWKICFQTTLSGGLVEGEGYVHEGITRVRYSPDRLPIKEGVLKEITKAIWPEISLREDVLLRVYGYPASQVTHPLEVEVTGWETTPKEVATIIRDAFGRFYSVCDVNWMGEPLN
jgi:hypothetical protein